MTSPTRENVWAGTSIASGAAALAPDERRLHRRFTVDIAARCLIDSLTPYDVRIVDISDGGFGLDCTLPLQPGSGLVIDLPGVGRFACVVAWISKARCGLKLLPQSGDLSVEQSEMLARGLSSLAGRQRG